MTSALSVMSLRAKDIILALCKFEAAYIPQTYTRLESEEDMKNMARMIDMFEENDDVQNIWHNWENEDEYEG